MTPQRIQLKRVRGWRKPEGAVVVSRPSRWGNPYRVGDLIRDPVNSVNPVAGQALRSDTPGVFERTSFHGDAWTQEIRLVIDAADAVALYRRLCDFEGFDLHELQGRDLACWCPLEDSAGNRVPCHADVLLLLANDGEVKP